LFNEHAGIEAALKQINPKTGHLQTLSGPLEDESPLRRSYQKAVLSMPRRVKFSVEAETHQPLKLLLR
jgi:hypothetical protein